MSRVLIVILLFWSVPAWAQVEVLDLPPVLELFVAPAKKWGIPMPLAQAIAVVESGLRPWVLNIEGQAFRFDSKEKALEKAREAWAAGRSFDVGIMQINSQWLRRYEILLEAALDPLANIYFGCWILKQEIIVHGGDLKAAVGAYHSPTPARARRYADQVLAALERGPKPLAGRSRQAQKQDIVSTEPPAGRGNHKMLVAPEKNMTASGADMVVISQKAGLATPGSMKAAATLPGNSMKVKIKK